MQDQKNELHIHLEWNLEDFSGNLPEKDTVINNFKKRVNWDLGTCISHPQQNFAEADDNSGIEIIERTP